MMLCLSPVFHSICIGTVCQSVDNVLQFGVAACPQINVVCKMMTEYGPPTPGQEGVVAMMDFSHDVLKEAVRYRRQDESSIDRHPLAPKYVVLYIGAHKVNQYYRYY